MSEKLPTATYIFVDRRKTGRGKSLPNRQRLLRRIKDAIRQSKPKDIDAGGVKGVTGGAGPVNPVNVTRDCLHEPVFHYASSSGEQDLVLVGNDEWERGDDFPLDGGEGDGKGGGEAGQGEDGEDDFVVNVSRDEFFNVFFEDCELPDLQDTHEKELPELMPKHAGFQKEGNPAQLSVVRSYKQALPRRRALTAESREELEELEAEYQVLALELADLDGEDRQDHELARIEEIHARMTEVELRITELREKIKSVPFFEKLDLRYTKKEKVLVKAADAVFMMIMDISASMDEDKKRIARKFFSLQYAFIKRKYPNTDLVFVAHTEKAYEFTEEEFFSTRISGGTMVSPSYEMLNSIVNARYDATQTNLYLSQASDGDNWVADNANIIPALEESGLLAKLRHMSYAQICRGWGDEGLWNVLQSIANTSKKISMVKIDDDSGVFDAFRQIYRKKTST